MGFLKRIFGSSEETDSWELFFASDLHGSNKCFKKLLNAPSFYDVDTLLIGGDWSGKALVPVVEQDQGWRIQYENENSHIDDEDELEEVETQIRNEGDYPYRMTKAELQEFHEDDDLVDELYREVRLARLEKWEEWAEDKLVGSPVDVYFIHGNDDHDYVQETLRSWSMMESVSGTVVRTQSGYEIAGYGWSNPTPWDTPAEQDEQGIEEDLEQLAAQVEEWSSTIFNCHCPPHNTEIDNAPKLDDELRPQTSGGEVLMEPVGSTSVREFIEDHQPLLGLHGHIHEGQGKYRIDNTLCLNPGSEYDEGYLNGVTVRLDGDEIVSHQFTSG